MERLNSVRQTGSRGEPGACRRTRARGARRFERKP